MLTVPLTNGVTLERTLQVLAVVQPALAAIADRRFVVFSELDPGTRIEKADGCVVKSKTESCVEKTVVAAPAATRTVIKLFAGVVKRTDAGARLAAGMVHVCTAEKLIGAGPQAAVLALSH